MLRDSVELGGRGGGGGIEEPRVRSGQLEPLLPIDFKGELSGNGVRLRVIDRDKRVDRSGTTHYVISHAADVDTTSVTGRNNGRSRATYVGQIFAPGEKGREGTLFVGDSRYTSGTFFCTAVNEAGKESVEYSWTQVASGEILDSSVPGPVEHVQVSESGFEVSPGVMVSELSISAFAPRPLGSFDGVQLYLGDYSAIGMIEEGAFEQHNGPSGGHINFKARYAPFRRGTGTITVTNGSAAVTVAGGKLLTEAKTGEVLEVLRHRSTILSVGGDTSMTLAAPWSGPTVTIAEFVILPLVTVYLVSVSKGGTRRTDIENAPNVQVLFDAELSAPNSPSVVLTAGGNVIRIAVTMPTGTQIAKATLYRGTGAAVAFSSTAPIKTWPSAEVNVSPVLRHEDNEFSLYEREQGQVFTYYATCTNVRGEESLPSVAQQIACGLDTGGDESPVVPSRNNAKNLLWNSFIYGTPGNSVDPTRTADDYAMGGGAPPAGHHRWDWTPFGATPDSVGHISTTELIIPAPGATAALEANQIIGAWGSAAAGTQRIESQAIYALSVYARHTPGSPNGTFGIWMDEWSAGVNLRTCELRSRDAGDNIVWTPGAVLIAGSDMTEDHQRYFGIFRTSSDSSVDAIHVHISHSFSNNGVNIIITKAMLSPGEELAAWTPELVDPDVIFPLPSGGVAPPGPYDDTERSRREWLRVP
jgi:hypothetical protein